MASDKVVHQFLKPLAIGVRAELIKELEPREKTVNARKNCRRRVVLACSPKL
jgi:hypothetical protein